MPTVFNGEVEFEWPDHVSSSQRNWWTCRLRAALATGARLSARADDSKPLLIGRLVHEVLGHHYQMPVEERSQRKLDQLADAAAFLSEWPDNIVRDALEDVHELLRKFWKRYGSVDGIVPIGVEIPINVPLPGVEDHYVGYIDMAYEDPEDGTIYVEDWKSSSTKIEPQQYTLMNPQMTDYLWAARTYLWPGRDVQLRYLFVTPYYTRRMEVPDLLVPDAGEELAALARERRELPITANRGYHCNSCRYSDLCRLSLTGAPISDILAKSYRRELTAQKVEVPDA